MTGLAVAAALLALGLAHGLRPGRGAGFPALVIFVLAFILAVAAVRMLAEGAGVARRTDMDRVVAGALAKAQASQSPVIAFVGASYSRNALDDTRIEAGLAAQGIDATVLNLSLEGASLQERERGLIALLDGLDRAPQAVFLEIAPEFDADPVYVFRVAKFSDRAITQFSPAASVAATRDLLSGGCTGAARCVMALGLTGAHAVMNASNLGLLHSGKTLAAVEPMRAFDPQVSPRVPVDATQRSEGLAQRPDTTLPPAHWGQGYRERLIAKLEARGVGLVGLYLPPVIDPSKRSYVHALCAASDRPCLDPSEPDLLRALDAPVWFDEGHLLAPGAQAVSDAYAGRLGALLSGKAQETPE
jgi:hypothetical protein